MVYGITVIKKQMEDIEYEKLKKIERNLLKRRQFLNEEKKTINLN